MHFSSRIGFITSLKTIAWSIGTTSFFSTGARIKFCPCVISAPQCAETIMHVVARTVYVLPTIFLFLKKESSQ